MVFKLLSLCTLRSVSATLPSGQLSAIPWRRSGVKYTNNEAYFDVIEEVDAIIDRNGQTVFSEIQGYIDCCCKLSGMPDLTLSFMNPRLFDDVSFHPCVRFKRWESERMLSFVPPDGNFRLMSYHIGSQSNVAIPIYVRHTLQFRSGEQGRLDITVGPKTTLGRTVEGVRLEIDMPKGVLNCALFANQGKYTYDPVQKLLHWDVGRLDVAKLPNLRGTVSVAVPTASAMSSGSSASASSAVAAGSSGLASMSALPGSGGSGGGLEANPSVNVHFSIPQLAVSGLKVNRLDMYGEKYKPFKGVKYVTKAGKFQIRM